MVYGYPSEVVTAVGSSVLSRGDGRSAIHLPTHTESIGLRDFFALLILNGTYQVRIFAENTGEIQIVGLSGGKDVWRTEIDGVTGFVGKGAGGEGVLYQDSGFRECIFHGSNGFAFRKISVF